MEKFVCIIPAKPLEEGKSRLAGTLANGIRQELIRRMLLRTIRLARQTTADVLVISRSAAVLDLATKEGALILHEANRSLNLALQQATLWAQAQGYAGVLILPIDLLLVGEKDLQEVLALGNEEAPVMAIAPCRARHGTNILLLKPAGLIPYQFGWKSFDRHLASARDLGAHITIIENPNFSLDLDTPPDIEEYQRRRPSPAGDEISRIIHGALQKTGPTE